MTGGTRGIGRATALKLAALGADVVVNYARREEDAVKMVEELTALNVEALAIRADISDLDEIHNLFAQLKDHFGGLDILINSAARGLQRPRNAMDSLPNHLRNTFELNVLGPWFATKEAAPLMEARGGGAVVNLTSIGAKRYAPQYAAVGVTKGALDTLTMYLAVELAPRKIRVNGVCPSWVEETGGTSAISGELGEAVLKMIPLGRHITSEDVANLVAFLCLPESEMIVGQSIILDGGATLVGAIGTG